MTSPAFDLLVRNRFMSFPEASIRHVRANVYEVRLPRSPEVERRLRGALDASEIVASLNEIEAFQAIVSADGPQGWTLTLLLP